jgi:hypothetical protein
MNAQDDGVIAGFDPLDMLKNLFQPFGVASHEFASIEYTRPLRSLLEGHNLFPLADFGTIRETALAQHFQFVNISPQLLVVVRDGEADEPPVTTREAVAGTMGSTLNVHLTRFLLCRGFPIAPASHRSEGSGP